MRSDGQTVCALRDTDERQTCRGVGRNRESWWDEMGTGTGIGEREERRKGGKEERDEGTTLYAAASTRGGDEQYGRGGVVVETRDLSLAGGVGLV